jgi:hypothetical protein
MKPDWLLFLIVIFTSLLLLIQRSDPKRRLWVIVFALIPMELLRQYAVASDASGEALLAILAALVLSFLFWLLIGRYNPPRSGDDIRVLGLDD